MIMVKLILSQSGSEMIENITLSLSVPEPFYTPETSIVVPSIGNYSLLYEQAHRFEDDKEIVQMVSFFGKTENILPTSLKVPVTASYLNSKGEPRTSQCDILLPLWMACKVVTPIKASNFKVVYCYLLMYSHLSDYN